MAHPKVESQFRTLIIPTDFCSPIRSPFRMNLYNGKSEKIYLLEGYDGQEGCNVLRLSAPNCVNLTDVGVFVALSESKLEVGTSNRAKKYEHVVVSDNDWVKSGTTRLSLFQPGVSVEPFLPPTRKSSGRLAGFDRMEKEEVDIMFKERRERRAVRGEKEAKLGKSGTKKNQKQEKKESKVAGKVGNTVAKSQSLICRQDGRYRASSGGHSCQGHH